MKKLYIIFFTTISLASFASNKSAEVIEEYYENGQLKIKKEYKDEKLNGKYEEYYENGQLEIEKEYNQDKLDGVYRVYREDGSIRYEFIYENGVLVSWEIRLIQDIKYLNLDWNEIPLLVV